MLDIKAINLSLDISEIYATTFKRLSQKLFNNRYRTIVAFEIDGGEHIGSSRTAILDRQKENICKNYGIKLIRIPNSAVKDYESIISLFEFVVCLKDTHHNDSPIINKLDLYKGRYLEIYKCLEQDYDMAALHAKTLSVDDSKSLITSANLSFHELEKNIELGCLIEPSNYPKTPLHI